MSFQVIIPARYESSRFPGKVLTDINGRSMLQRVYEQACKSGAEQVVVATDHPEIEALAESLGATVCMTERSSHQSGTDRIAEAALMLGFDDDDIIVNVQCDQPLIEPALIKSAADILTQGESIGAATLCTPITTLEELHDPNIVKVVFNHRNKAIYFSRSMIPYQRALLAKDATDGLLVDKPYYRHIGIYAYNMAFLQEFVAWDDCEIEQIEKLEQLRILWYGKRIHVAVVDHATTVSVDAPEDVNKVLAALKKKTK